MQEINYGKLLKEMRERKGISRYKLAKLSGLGESTIQMWENEGIEPTVKNYNKVLVALEESLTIGK